MNAVRNVIQWGKLKGRHETPHPNIILFRINNIHNALGGL